MSTSAAIAGCRRRCWPSVAAPVAQESPRQNSSAIRTPLVRRLGGFGCRPPRAGTSTPRQPRALPHPGWSRPRWRIPGGMRGAACRSAAVHLVSVAGFWLTRRRSPPELDRFVATNYVTAAEKSGIPDFPGAADKPCRARATSYSLRLHIRSHSMISPMVELCPWRNWVSRWPVSPQGNGLSPGRACVRGRTAPAGRAGSACRPANSSSARRTGLGNRTVK